MTHQPSSISTISGDEAGWGIFGCLSGLILGVIGGVMLLVAVSLLAALFGASPSPGPTPPGKPDLRITLEENFINRFAAQPTAETVKLDVLPGNQVKLTVDTTVEALGLQVPVQIAGLFQVQYIGQTLQVTLLDTQVVGVSIPLDLTGYFAQNTAVINQELNLMVSEISKTFNAPVVITNLSTTDNQILLNIREVQ